MYNSGDLRKAPDLSLHDLSGLKGLLRSQIMPVDIDGFVEMSGHFLFIELKQPGEKLSAGQASALGRLSLQPRTTVYIVQAPLRESSDDLVVVVTPHLKTDGSNEFEFRSTETSRQGWHDIYQAWGVGK